LARAESREYRLEKGNSQDPLLDAIDEMRTLVKNKSANLATDIVEVEFCVYVDRTLTSRTLINPLPNAINYNSRNTRVLCTSHHSLSVFQRQIFCSIPDQESGIALDDQAKLFRPSGAFNASMCLIGQGMADRFGFGLCQNAG
jgi:signal transduction histidine kinase